MAKESEYDGSTMITGAYAVMREAFVTNIIAGIVQYKAYKDAGYSPNQSDNAAMASSTALLRNPKVKARLAYKRTELAKKTDITAESQVKRLQELSKLGQKLNQVSAAVSAEDRINTLLGLYSKDNAQKGLTLVEILAIAGPVKPVLEAEMGDNA